MAKKSLSDGVKIKGFFRLNIIEDDKVVGDSGWIANQITNAGYSNFIMGPMAADAASSLISIAALGTGTAPASNATALPGEVAQVTNGRFSVVKTISGTKSLQFTGSLNSGIWTTTAAIANVGLFATSAMTVGTVACGMTYATSTLATNQSVNLTYSITFA